MHGSDGDPGLPIKLGPCPNGEYEPEPLPGEVVRGLRLAKRLVNEGARKTGMTRRQFLLSAAGAATTLFALDLAWAQSSAATGTPLGGRYRIGPEALLELEVAAVFVSGTEFVMDIQGHLLEYDLNPATRGRSYWGDVFPQRYCGDGDSRECFSMEHFMEEMFLRSDTSVVVLSALPILPEGSPLPLEVMKETRRVAKGLSENDHILLHAQALPHIGTWTANAEAMAANVEEVPVAGWKTFTHLRDPSTGQGWFFDDHEPNVAQVGNSFVETSRELGISTICVHKGLSGGSRFGSPRDIGPAAVTHPEMNFVVYHCGFETKITEGPYTEATRDRGVNRLISTLRDNDVKRNSNVYAKLGSTWWYLMRSPNEAAHVLGKLLRWVGEDNILWGTDSIFYGSPQDQIQAFRAFEITREFQERYGYPALGRRAKAKILGLNAARLYGVEPETRKFGSTLDEMRAVRQTLPTTFTTYGPQTSSQVRAFEEHHQGWP